MKKVIYSVAMMSILTFGLASCGSSDTKTEVADTIPTEEAIPVSDIDSKLNNMTSEDDAQLVWADAQSEAAQLVSDGKVQEAKSLLERVKNAITEKYPKLTEVVTNDAINDILESAKDLKEDASDRSSDAIDEAKDKAEELKDKAKDKVEDLKEKASDVKEKASEVKEKAKEKAKDVKDKAKDVKDKANDAKDKLKDLL